MPVLLAAAILLQVQQFRDDAKDWRLLKSAHFDVHFPADALEPRAKEFAAMFEDARERIAKTCGVTLERRINVFLYRSFHELTQASLLGHPRAGLPFDDFRRPQLDRGGEIAPRGCSLTLSRALALAEPLRDRILIHCQGSDRWNQWFVRHELVHQLQFQQIFPWRLPSYLLAMKDPLIPQWFWEGYADYGADIFDSEKDEWVRDLAEEHLYSLKEMFSGDALDDHDTLAVYFEGSMFFRFLDEECGAGTANKVFATYAKTFPLTMERVLTSSTGRGRKELEAAFAGWLKRRYEPMMKDRGTPERRVTDSRQFYRRHTLAGRWSPDGKRIAWVGDANTKPEVFVDGVGQLGWRRLLDVDGINSPPSWSPDGTRLAVVVWYHHHDYLFLIDVGGGSTALTLDVDEIFDPAWSPDGATIAFSGNKDGRTDLFLYDIAGASIRRLTDDVDGDSAPAWSPDGKSLVFIHETGGRTDLTVLSLAGGERRVVTKTNALVERPQWTPDGKSLVVSADVGGVYDAFAIDAATGAASRLTRFRGGVHFPAVSPDGKTLLFTYFEKRTLDLYTVAWAPQDEKDFAQENRKDWYDQFVKPAPQGERAEKSRSFAIEYLMIPVSSASFALPGLDFQAGDLEGENLLGVNGVIAGRNTWIAQGSVSNTRWWPTIGVGAKAASLGSLRQAGGGPFVILPHYGTALGWIARDTHEFDDAQNDPHEFDSGPTLGFLDTKQMGVHPYDSSWGASISATASFFRKAFGGDRDLDEYFTAFETSYAVSQDVIVWARAVYEKKVGGPLLASESLLLRDAVRGARGLEGTDRGAATLEVRFPIWRNLFWMPIEVLGLGEYLLLKDLRGFVFGDAGFAGTEFLDIHMRRFGAISGGVGLRLDFFWMLFPVANARVATRVEVWYAVVGEQGDAPRGALGFALTLGY